jgi:hypothetical protein
MELLVNTELVIGEDRVFQLNLLEAVGDAPLLVGGWTLQLRLGGAERRYTTALAVDPLTPGRVSCVFVPGELAVVGAGVAIFAIWRIDTGAVTLVAEGTVLVRRVW